MGAPAEQIIVLSSNLAATVSVHSVSYILHSPNLAGPQL